MTPDLAEAVRRACDAERPSAASRECDWPLCYCAHDEVPIATLLAAARAEGAKAEREACKELADEWNDTALGRNIAAAIRARGAAPLPTPPGDGA